MDEHTDNPSIDRNLFLKLDKSKVSICSFEEGEAEDRAFWHSRTPEERLWYMEELRRINYGYETPRRLQRLLEFVEPGQD